ISGCRGPAARSCAPLLSRVKTRALRPRSARRSLFFGVPGGFFEISLQGQLETALEHAHHARVLVVADAEARDEGRLQPVEKGLMCAHHPARRRRLVDSEERADFLDRELLAERVAQERAIARVDGSVRGVERRAKLRVKLAPRVLELRIRRRAEEAPE